MKKRLVSGLLGMMVVLSGCAAQVEASPSPEAVRQPVAGECKTYDYAAGRLFSEQSEPVACDGPHTAQTVYVAQVPDSELPTLEAYWTRDATGEPAVLADGFVKETISKCTAEQGALLGVKDGHISNRFSMNWFGPSRESWALGDRAFRCDATMRSESVDGAGDTQMQLDNLPAASLADFVSSHAPLEWAYCMRWTSETGVTAKGPCNTEPGTLLAIAEADLWADSTSWPGDEAVSGDATPWCRGRVTHFTTQPSSRNITVSPGEEGWAEGSRRAYCYMDIADWNGSVRAIG